MYNLNRTGMPFAFFIKSQIFEIVLLNLMYIRIICV